MFPLQLDVGVDGLVVVLFLVLALPVVGIVLLVGRWGRLGTQLGLLRRRLGMSRPLGLAVGLAMLVGFFTPLVAGDPPNDGAAESGFVLGMVLYLAGVFVGGWALARRDHLRLVRETPTRETGGLLQPGDLVELAGETAPVDETVTAPVSGTEVLAYRYRVEERRFGGRRRMWVPVDHGRDGVPFTVDDGSGPTVVDPEGVRLDVDRDELFSVDEDEALTDAPVELVGAIDGVGGDDELRFAEWRLEPGELAYVLGEAVDRPSPDALSRMAVADGDGPFILADGPEASLERRLRLLVVYGGPGGVVSAVGGMVLMLRLSGVV